MAKSFLSGYRTYDTSEGYGHAKQWRNSFYDRIGDKEAIEILESQNETPYSLLGLKNEAATQQEIKSAFRKKMMEWHPDFNPSRLEEATAMSKKIIAAYSYLYKG